MRRQMIASTVVALLLSTGLSYGGEPQGLPEEIMKELGALVGTWEFEGEFGDQSFKGRFSARWGPGKRYLIGNSRGSMGDVQTRGNSIMGWDPVKKQIVDCGFETLGLRLNVRTR